MAKKGYKKKSADEESIRSVANEFIDLTIIL
jgi:hypothetical protein